MAHRASLLSSSSFATSPPERRGPLPFSPESRNNIEQIREEAAGYVERAGDEEEVIRVLDDLRASLPQVDLMREMIHQIAAQRARAWGPALAERLASRRDGWVEQMLQNPHATPEARAHAAEILVLRLEEKGLPSRDRTSGGVLRAKGGEMWPAEKLRHFAHHGEIREGSSLYQRLRALLATAGQMPGDERLMEPLLEVFLGVRNLSLPERLSLVELLRPSAPARAALARHFTSGEEVWQALLRAPWDAPLMEAFSTSRAVESPAVRAVLRPYGRWQEPKVLLRLLATAADAKEFAALFREIPGDASSIAAEALHQARAEMLLALHKEDLLPVLQAESAEHRMVGLRVWAALRAERLRALRTGEGFREQLLHLAEEEPAAAAEGLVQATAAHLASLSWQDWQNLQNSPVEVLASAAARRAAEMPRSPSVTR